MEKTFGRYTNETYERYYKNVVNRLGLENIRPIIPFTKEELVEAYAINTSFNTNNTPIRKWNAAAGFSENPKSGIITIFGSKLIMMLKNEGVTSFSPSQLVCILKEAAKMIVEEESA